MAGIPMSRTATRRGSVPLGISSAERGGATGSRTRAVAREEADDQQLTKRQVPLYYGHKPSGGRSHWKEDYVDGSYRPLWPFGFGRSYTTFDVADLGLDRRELAADGEVGISVNVINTGQRAGDEVVQLYVRDVEASVSRPFLELRGFARVTLEPGERRSVTFRLAADALAFTGVDGRLRLEPGAFEVRLGTSSADLPLAARLELTGDVVVPFERTRYFTTVEVR